MSVINLLDYLGIEKDDFSWQDLALCRGDGQTTAAEIKERSDLFYDTYEVDTIAAVQSDLLCGSCPVRSECGLYGQENRQWGVWGGVYWDGSGKPDLDRNAHKTWPEWQEAMKYVYIPEKTIAEIKRRLNVT